MAVPISSDLTVVPVIEGLGTAGQTTANLLYEAINEFATEHGHDVRIIWDHHMRQFAIFSVPALSQQQIQAILQARTYEDWKPVLADYSTKQVTLKLVPVPLSHDLFKETIGQDFSSFAWGVSDSDRTFETIDPFVRGLHALDVGCGSGRTTARMLKEVKPRMLNAIEPGTEYETARDFLQGYDVPVDRLTLEEAVQKDEYKQRFDAVTVFKYNVGYLQCTAFARALSEAIHQDGVVIITSVEKDRCYKGAQYDKSLYMMDDLKTYFTSVEMQVVRHARQREEGLILCRGPRAGRV